MMAMQDGHADDIASAAAAQPEAVPPPDCVAEVEEEDDVMPSGVSYRSLAASFEMD